MAYQEYAIASLDDIPATVAAFATDLGWNVTYAGGKPVLKHPDYLGDGLPGGPGFQLGVERPSSNGQNGAPNNIGYADKFVDLVWRFTTGETTDGAVMRSPLFGNLENRPAPKVLTPTKLFLIGMMSPAPYIAIVVQFGYNLYRHLYMGFMEKEGVYENGAVISAHNGDMNNTNRDRYWLWHGYQQFLFSGFNTWGAVGQNGGVYVDSPTLTQKWRRFRSNGMTSNPANFYQQLNGSEVFGGMRDGQAHAMVTKGKNSFAGAQVLVPMNLFVTRMLADEYRLKPIGRPPGVRMVNIAELEPEAQVEVGGEQWYSFAANSKQNDNYNRRFYQSNDVRSDFVMQETSYNLGYAYRG